MPRLMQEAAGQGEARDGEGGSWHGLEHGMGASGEDRQELRGIFKAQLQARPRCASCANPRVFMPNI